MNVSVAQFQRLLKSREDEHLEFKEAKESYSYEKLACTICSKRERSRESAVGGASVTSSPGAITG